MRSRHCFRPTLDLLPSRITPSDMGPVVLSVYSPPEAPPALAVSADPSTAAVAPGDVGTSDPGAMPSSGDPGAMPSSGDPGAMPSSGDPGAIPSSGDPCADPDAPLWTAATIYGACEFE